MNGNLTLTFMIQCKYYKKSHHLRKYLLVIALWIDVFIVYISLNPSNPFSIFLRQFYPGDLANFAGSTIIFIVALIIRWFSQIVALPRWTWLLFSSMTSVPDSIFFPLPLPPSFLALFWCNKFMGVSFIETFGISLRFNG